MYTVSDADKPSRMDLEVAYQVSFAYAWDLAEKLSTEDVLKLIQRWYPRQASIHSRIAMESCGMVDAMTEVLVSREKTDLWLGVD